MTAIHMVATHLASAALLIGPTPAPMAESCPCPELLSALVEKVEASYPGYHLEIAGRPAEADYRLRLERARADAASAEPGIPCLKVLQTYVAGFEEGHLFVGGRPRIDTAEDSARLREAAPRYSRTEAEVLDHLDSGRVLDPVEGIWVDPVGLRLAIVRDEGTRFVAFVLESTAEGWAQGDVKAELEALADGSYDAILYDDTRSGTRPHVHTRGLAGGARLQRDGLLLHLPPTTWGKLHPVRPGHEGRIDPVDPRAPTARTIGDDVVVFHVPSHVPSHARRVSALVEQYRGALGRAETLVIDLRGNEGGSTRTTNALVPFLTTREQRPPRYLAGGESAVVAAEDNIAYFQRMTWAPPRLVERLEAADPGTIISFADPPAPGAGEEVAGEEGGADSSAAADGEPAFPRNVAILTDRMTVSAAEAFVLRAMRSRKVTLFGEPTGSSIDYQNVGIVGFGCREAGLYVGYPTIIGSDRLPEGGVRPTGIVPDVPLDADAADPVAGIIRHYRTRR